MQYKIGEKIKGKVIRILPSGVSVQLSDGSKGWIRKRDLSWFHDFRPTSDFAKIGAEIEAVVMESGEKTDVFHLSLREAVDNPWLSLREKLKAKSLVEGIVTKLYPKGAYVLLLEKSVEGFVSLDQIAPDIKKPEEAILPGDSVLCRVKGIDAANREIDLSIRDAIEEDNQATLRNTHWDILTETYNKASLRYIQTRFGKSDTKPSGLSNGYERIVVERTINRILIVENDERARTALQNLLERMGYTDVETCSSGEKAIQLLMEKDFDLVLMDKLLPGIDGIEATRKILEKKPDARIVIVTGEPDWAERLPEIEALGCGFSLKPIDKEEMEQILLDASIDNLGIGISDFGSIPSQTAEEETKKMDKTESLSELVERIISREEYNLRADVVAVLHIDLRTYQVDLVASNKDLSKSYEREKHNLIYSPIKDVILGNAPLIESDAPVLSAEKFRYLLPFLDFSSFLGIPIKVNDSITYGLFYFHHKPEQFSSEHIPKAQLIAELLGVMIEKKLLEDQIAVSQKLVFAGEMSYAFRHELRNTLTPISAGIDILKMDADDIFSGKLNSANKRFIERFVSITEDIHQVKNEILNSVKTFQTLMSEEKKEEKENINAIVSFAIQMLTPEADEAKIQLRPELDENIPKTILSRTNLQYLFINLLLNAIQWGGNYRKKGGKIIIQTRYESDDDCSIKVRFIDNGPGIHRIEWDRIFDPLITTREGGTGIGLFFSRALARVMGAKVFVEKSLIFVGTTFRVDIPLREEKNV